MTSPKNTSTSSGFDKKQFSQSNFIKNVAYSLTIIPISFSAMALLQPKQALPQFFQIEYPLLAQEQRSVKHLLAALALRDLFLASSLLLSLRFGTRRGTGYLFISVGFFAALDEISKYIQTGKNVIPHWIFVPIAILVGLTFIGTFD